MILGIEYRNLKHTKTHQLYFLKENGKWFLLEKRNIKPLGMSRSQKRRMKLANSVIVELEQ